MATKKTLKTKENTAGKSLPDLYVIEAGNRKGFVVQFYWVGMYEGNVVVLSSPYRAQFLPEGFSLTKKSEDFVEKHPEYSIDIKFSEETYREYSNDEFREWLSKQVNIVCQL